MPEEEGLVQVIVLVCGGRDYSDRERLATELLKLHAATPIKTLVNGGAKGADALAASWALFHGIQVKTFHADWNTHGRAAGPIRNQKMLDVAMPDLVIAFPGGRGTADMVGRAKKQGFEVREIR